MFLNSKFIRIDIIFFILLIFDIMIRVLAVMNHNNWYLGDLLVPLFLTDQFFHQETPNLSIFQPFIPMLVGNLMRILGAPNDFITMLHISGIVTAVSSSLTLVPLYVIARKFLTPIRPSAALWVTVLLMTNAWFSLNSYFFNPIHVYTLFFTISIAMMLFYNNKSTTYIVLFATIVGLSYYIRHEGIVLSITSVLFILSSWKRKDIHNRQALYAILIISGLVVFNWIIRIQNPMTDALGFIKSSAATADNGILSFGIFAFLDYSFIKIFNLLQINLNYMLQSIGAALLANLTFIGILFVPLGYYYLKRQNINFSWVFVYWFIYILTLFILLFIQPTTIVGNLSYLEVPNDFNAGPFTRYHQVLTPLFLLFAYAGILFLTKELSEWKKFLVHICVVFLLLHQITLTGYHFLNNYKHFDKNNSYLTTKEYIMTTQFFRDRNIRQANILYYESNHRNKIFFSYMSGGNTVNCWNGSRFGRPRNEYNCFHKYPENTFDSLLKAKREIFGYIITHTQEPPRYLLRQYSQVFTSGPFRIYKHK